MSGVPVERERRVLSLRDAVNVFARMPGSWTNSYDWWRRSAIDGGRLFFGRRRQLVPSTADGVSVFKQSRRWVVDADEFDAAMAEHAAWLAELDFISAEYAERRLLVGPGSSLATRSGGYRVYPDFHVRSGSRRGTGEGISEWWVCNNCWRAADLEHDREECHRCRDWGSCGRDCTLTAVTCTTCHTRQTV